MIDFMQRQKNSAIARKKQAILERHDAKEMAKQANMNGPDMPVVPTEMPGASAMSAVPTGIPGAPVIPGIVPPAMPGASAMSAVPTGIPAVPPAIPEMPSGNSPSPFEIKMPSNPMDDISDKLNKPLKSMFEFKATPYTLLPNQGKVTEEDPTAKAAIGKISDVIVDDIETSEKKTNLIGKGLFQKLINSIDVDEFKKQLGPMVKKELNAIYENNTELQEALCKIWILAFRSRTYPVFNAAFETMSGKALKDSDKLNKQVANNTNKPAEISVDVPEEGDEHEDGDEEDSESEEGDEHEDSESKTDVASKITTLKGATPEGRPLEKKMTGGQKKMTNSHIYDVFIYYKREFLESIIDKRAIFNSASYQTVFNSQKSLIAKMVRHYAIIPRDILLGKLSKLIVGVEDFNQLAELDEAPAGDEHLFGIFNGILSELINKKLRQPGEYDGDDEDDGDDDDEDDDEDDEDEDDDDDEKSNDGNQEKPDEKDDNSKVTDPKQQPPIRDAQSMQPKPNDKPIVSSAVVGVPSPSVVRKYSDTGKNSATFMSNNSDLKNSIRGQPYSGVVPGALKTVDTKSEQKFNQSNDIKGDLQIQPNDGANNPVTLESDNPVKTTLLVKKAIKKLAANNASKKSGLGDGSVASSNNVGDSDSSPDMSDFYDDNDDDNDNDNDDNSTSSESSYDEDSSYVFRGKKEKAKVNTPSNELSSTLKNDGQNNMPDNDLNFHNSVIRNIDNNLKTENKYKNEQKAVSKEYGSATTNTEFNDSYYYHVNAIQNIINAELKPKLAELQQLKQTKYPSDENLQNLINYCETLLTEYTQSSTENTPTDGSRANSNNGSTDGSRANSNNGSTDGSRSNSNSNNDSKVDSQAISNSNNGSEPELKSDSVKIDNYFNNDDDPAAVVLKTQEKRKKLNRELPQLGGSNRAEENLIKMREQIMKLWDVSQKLKRVSTNRHKTPQSTDEGKYSRANPRMLTATPRPAFFAISRGGGDGDEEEEENTPVKEDPGEPKVYDDENLSTRPRYMPASYDWYYIEKKVADDLEKYIIMLFKQSENQIKDVFRNVCKQYNAAYLNDYSETSIMRQYAQEEFNNMLLGFCENINNTTAEQILYHCAFGPKFDELEEAFAGDVFSEENHPSIIESIIGYGRIVKKFFETDVFKLDIPTRSFENIANNANAVVDSVKETVSEREPEDNDTDANETEVDADKEKNNEEGSNDDDSEEAKAKANNDHEDEIRGYQYVGRHVDKRNKDIVGGDHPTKKTETSDPETEHNEDTNKPNAKPDKKTKELPDFIKFNFDSKKYKDAFTAWPFSYKWEPAILKVAYTVLDNIFKAALQDTVFLGEVFTIYSNSAVQFMQDIVEDFEHHKNKLKVYVENYVILKNPHIKIILTKCMNETIALWLTKKAEECDPKHLAIYTLFLLYFYLSSSEKKLSWNTHTETGEVKEDEEPDNEVPVDNEELGNEEPGNEEPGNEELGNEELDNEEPGNEVPVGNDETEASGDNKEQQSKPHIYNPIDKTINNAIREFSDIFLNGQTEILDHFRAISNESTLQFEYNQFFVKAMESAEESVEEESSQEESAEAESTQEESNADGEQQGGGQKKTKYRRPKSKHRTLRRKSGRRFIGK